MYNHRDKNSKDYSGNNHPSYDLKGLLDYAKRTVPRGVEVLDDELAVSKTKLKHGTLALVVIKLFIPLDREPSIKAWLKEVERIFKVNLIIQRQTQYNGIHSFLKKYFWDVNIITADDIPKLESVKDYFFGEVPLIYNDLKSRDEIVDYSNFQFIAIDDEGTIDPEDAIYIQRIGKNDFRVLVAITDVSSFFPINSPQLEYALNIGAAVYGSESFISPLGNLPATGLSHFSLREKRPAWIIQFDIFSDRKIKSISDPFLANITVSRSISPKQMSQMADSEQVRLLLLAASFLRCQRLCVPASYKNNNFNSLIKSNDIVSEFMIRAKERFATFIAKNNTGIFKVQQGLSINKIRELRRLILSNELEATSQSFKDPEKLIQLLLKLQELRTSSDSEDIDFGIKSILDAILVRPHYDINNRGHLGLKVTSYCDIKGRLAAGIVNQVIARNIQQNKISPFKTFELQEMTENINFQMQNYGVKVYTLRFLEMLTSKLYKSGEQFYGKIVKVKGNKAFIEVDGFKRWGLITGNSHVRCNCRYLFTLCGYSLNEERFVFYL